MGEPSRVTHQFSKSLEKSHEYADAHWWLEVYRAAFPNLVCAADVRKDGWAQRGGIDRVLTLNSSKILTVDEKVRKKDWPDILLEYWSDIDRQTRGWAAKDLGCDYIAYAFVPSATCYLLPFQELRRVWRKNRKIWVAEYKRIEAKNEENGRKWTTVSVAVPTPVLLDAIRDAMVVCWHKEAAE